MGLAENNNCKLPTDVLDKSALELIALLRYCEELKTSRITRCELKVYIKEGKRNYSGAHLQNF